MMASLHVLRYISNDLTQGILFSNSVDTSLVAYTDSDWVACATSRKSVSSFYVSLGGCPISWKSKKKPTISLSSAEAEYRALRMVVVEVSWLIRLLGDMGLSFFSPVPIFYDSQVALHIAKNPVFHERTKHIEIDCHFVMEKIVQGMIKNFYISTKEQLADLLTKSLGKLQHDYLWSKLGLKTYFNHQFEGRC